MKLLGHVKNCSVIAGYDGKVHFFIALTPFERYRHTSATEFFLPITCCAFDCSIRQQTTSVLSEIVTFCLL